MLDVGEETLIVDEVGGWRDQGGQEDLMDLMAEWREGMDTLTPDLGMTSTQTGGKVDSRERIWISVASTYLGGLSLMRSALLGRGSWAMLQ